MEITGDRSLSQPPAHVWRGLLDARILQAAIPGCEDVTDLGGGRYTAVVVASVGPVRARFKGRVTMRDLVEPQSMALDFEGDSGIAGFATGSATITLAPEGQGTRLGWKAESQIGGRLAQIGSRLIDATVARMSKQFFDRFEEVLANPALLDTTPAATPAIAARTPAPALAAVPGAVTLQMPAWVFATSVIALAVLIGWLGVQ